MVEYLSSTLSVYFCLVDDSVDFHQLSDGSLEVKMILPKHLWSDPKFVGTLKEGIIDGEGRLLLSQ